MKSKNEILEDSLLLAADAYKEQAKDQCTKMLAELFKSVVLKKYKDAFDDELTKGEVHQKNIDKSVEFCYNDICVTIRKSPTIKDKEKDDLIQKGKDVLPMIKSISTQILLDKGVKIV